MSASTAGSSSAYEEPGRLFMSERWWRDHHDDIVGRGYRLRPRYHPQWEPSWLRTGKDFFSTEDGQPNVLRTVMDAIRIRDGCPVMLKKVMPMEGPRELKINQLFSSAEHSREHDNHCVPLLDVIELSKHSESQRSQQLMVFPLLRPFDQPRIQTFAEFTKFYMTYSCLILSTQGIRFMHQRNVAHRDCTAYNIMFDPSQMYPNGFHPVMIDRNRNFEGTAKAYTRTQRPPRYYFVDFGLSCQYTSRNAMDEPLRGGDKSAPEHRSRQRCNPFHTDIYYLGNLVRQKFMKARNRRYNGFEFMEDLVASMTQDNPMGRPPIEGVLQEFSHIRASLSGIKLRLAIISK
ncbi:hypothetical protein H4582DRAFT_2163423, partial [Lactarius indigo]